MDVQDLVAFVVTAVIAGTVPADTAPRNRHVLIVGDSEACAVAPYAKPVAWQTNDAAHEPHDDIEIDCKPGTVVQYWGGQGNLRAALERHARPDVVVVFLGTNHYREATAAPPVMPILDIISEQGARCVWIGNTAVHGKKWPINRLLSAAVQPTCEYFDTEAAGIELIDGVHPTKQGAVKWLNLVWPMVTGVELGRND